MLPSLCRFLTWRVKPSCSKRFPSLPYLLNSTLIFLWIMTSIEHCCTNYPMPCWWSRHKSSYINLVKYFVAFTLAKQNTNQQIQRDSTPGICISFMETVGYALSTMTIFILRKSDYKLDVLIKHSGYFSIKNLSAKSDRGTVPCC